MRELIGFNNFPNDFVNLSLRAKLSKKYGLFGEIPMWGGIRLHRFYPPLSTIFVRLFGITGTLIFYFIFTFGIWTYYQGPLVGLLFLMSYYHLPQILYVGRLSELLGYSFIAFAFFNSNPITSGIFLGLGGLCYPTPLLIGGVILLFKFDFLIYSVAFLVCGWWYIPFIFNYKELHFLKERREDKFSGLYYMQWMIMFNFLIFLFGDLWIRLIVSILGWAYPGYLRYGLFPGRFIFRGSANQIMNRIKRYLLLHPFYTDDVPRIIPEINKIKEEVIFLEYPSMDRRNQDTYSGSLKPWIWACANYLIDKGVVVYNGLPSTEVSSKNIKISESIRGYSLSDLGLESIERGV